MHTAFWTTYALCGLHATAYLGNIAPDAEIKVHFDDDVWVASHYESETEWTLDACDVPRLRVASGCF